MAKSNYDKMFKKEEVVETPVEEVVEATETTEVPVEEKKEAKKNEEVKKNNDKIGTVIGEASLNVRQNPTITSGILTTLTPGVKVTIEEDSKDWYKISAPVSGFVMKKFIEV